MRPNVAGASTVLPAGKDVLEDLQVAGDGLYVLSRTGGFGRIARVSLAADGTPGASRDVDLPFQGAINAIATDSREPGVVFGLTGWTHSLLYFEADANGSGRRYASQSARERRHVAVHVVGSPSAQRRRHDGAALGRLSQRAPAQRHRIRPISRDTAAYGITLEPAFSATRVAWLERGGVFAVCHPRAAAGTARPGIAPA